MLHHNPCKQNAVVSLTDKPGSSITAIVYVTLSKVQKASVKSAVEGAMPLSGGLEKAAKTLHDLGFDPQDT